jgi:hypothetical protein
MATFEIITTTSFTNVYLVEAESKEEAEKLALEGDVDFLQKYNEEEILANEEHETTWEEFYSNYVKQGFF